MATAEPPARIVAPSPLETGLGRLAAPLQLAPGATGWGPWAGTFSAAPVTALSLPSGATGPEPARAFLEDLITAARAVDQGEQLFLAGYLGYDFGRLLMGLPSRHPPAFRAPLAWAGGYDWALRAGQLELPAAAAHGRRDEIDRLVAGLAAQPRPTAFTCRNFQPADQAAYQHAFDRLQCYIQAGDCYQANLSLCYAARIDGDPAGAWQAAQTAATPPFASYLGLADGALLSFSPEEFLRVQNRQVRTRPIKGTRPRDAKPAEDARLREELAGSDKDRAENLMIVDLLRNDLGRFCRIGSVTVPDLFRLESFAAVHHLVSTVTGELRENVHPFELLAGCLPGGSITGAPKRRAMQIIDELEDAARHLYCGTQFLYTGGGTLYSSILIRCVQVEGGMAVCRGGGGIVADSDCDGEYREAGDKVRGILAALGRT